MNNKRVGLTVAGAICVVALICLIIFTGTEQKEEQIKVGFVATGSAEESGWNGKHYKGVQAASEALNVALLTKENVKEFSGECNRAIRELAGADAGMIILSSYGYSEEVKELVKEYPDISFYVNSSEYHDVNMTSYFVRMYQARYLAGIVAGMTTQSNKIGYVAAMANNEVNRGINAFTLGVRRVNPEAEVIVAWTGEWDHAETEMQKANLLIEQESVDVLTYHQNRTNVVEAAEAAGIFSIGYHEALSGCSDKYLTCVVCNWETVYEQIIREFLVGNANMKDNYWIGMEADAVGLSEYSAAVSQETVAEVEKAKNEILTGMDVFSGVIYDNNGVIRCREKEVISDEVLLEQMDWFTEGVRVYEG